MSNKVWVTWKGAAGEDPLVDKVIDLADNADVSDLRTEFVAARSPVEIDAATVEVFKTKGGEKLKADDLLQPYFALPPGSAGVAEPGQSKDTALFVTFPSQTNELRKIKELGGSQLPPLHPSFEHKLDQILEATRNTDRATPQYSAAFVGNKEKKRLVIDGRFLAFEEKFGEASVLTAEQVKTLSTMKNEHQVVAYMTPFLAEIVRDTISCSVFNSEEYKWIETSSETSIYNEKPDLIIIHPALINIRPPFKSEKDKTLKEMRRDSDKYGVLAQWKLRDFIGLTCEAKQVIDNAGFGEVINYGAHICFGAHGSVATRLILFDKQVFWLVESVKGAVASVVTSRWLDHGSKQLLRGFIRQPALLKLLNDACKFFNLTVASDSFLGAGAFGFVFRARRVDGGLIALKVVLDQHSDTNVQRLEAEKGRILRAKNSCPDEVMGMEEDGFHVFEDGAALLLSTVGEHFSRLSPQSIVDSLQRLHNSGIIHGDARLENVVCVNGKPCWIDFADSDLLLDAPLLMEREMNELIGFVKERFEGYKAVC